MDLLKYVTYVRFTHSFIICNYLRKSEYLLDLQGKENCNATVNNFFYLLDSVSNTALREIVKRISTRYHTHLHALSLIS